MEQKHLRVDQLNLGPIRHAELSPALIARIASLRSMLNDAYSLSMEQWLDGFQRDVHPEREVTWWERLAACYSEYSRQHALGLKDKKAVFNVMLGLALGSTVNDLAQAALALPVGSLNEILSIMGRV